MDMTQYAGSSKWLRASDLIEHKRDKIVLRIKAQTLSVFTDDSGHSVEQPVLHFYDTGKQLGLNKTNVNTMIHLYGVDSDGWMEQPITIYVTKTKNNKQQLVDCLRIEGEIPVRRIAQQTEQSAPVTLPQTQPANNDWQQLKATPQLDKIVRKNYTVSSGFKPAPDNPDTDELPDDDIPF